MPPDFTRENLETSSTPKTKNKVFLVPFILIIVAVLVVGGFSFLKRPLVPQNTETKDFKDVELGVSFSYPQAWGEVEKHTVAHVSSTPFDLEHEFTFTANPLVSLSTLYVGEPELFRRHTDFAVALEEKEKGRTVFCGDNLHMYDGPTDNADPKIPHSSFREFGTYGYGSCDEKTVSFITVKKQNNGNEDNVSMEKQGSSTIKISKTYVVEPGNKLYSPLKITIKLPDIISDDFCELKWGVKGEKLKRFSCVTYPDKEAIEGVINSFEKTPVNQEVNKLVNSIFVENVSLQDARSFTEEYFKTKTSYSDKKFGIEFTYPSILPVPKLTEEGNSVSIDDFEIVTKTSRQDAMNAEKDAEECEGMCFGPAITADEWDMHLDMLTKNVVDKEECEECISISTMGNRKFLTLFEGNVGYSGHPGKRYVTYQNGYRYEFNGFSNSFGLGTRFTLAEFDTFSEESLMQKVIKDIISSVTIL